MRILILAAAAALATPVSAAEPGRFSVTVIGSGPDVILIPGLSSTRDVFAATAERLKARHRVHLVQLRGFGEPAGANASGPVLVPFVDELAAYAARLEKPAIVGHSMGGLTALMIAARHRGVPGRVLVVDALPFIGTLFGAADVAAVTPQAERMRAMIAGAKAPPPDFAQRADCPATLPAPAPAVGNMTNSGAGACLMAHGAKVSDMRVVGQVMTEVMMTDLRPEIPRIAAPVTVLYPQDDRLLSASAAAKIYGEAYANLPTARLIPVRGSYHFIMQDQPARFADAIDAFLR